MNEHRRWQLPSLRSYLGSFLLLTLTYFVTAHAGLRWAVVNGTVSPVYPAAGVAVAGLLLGGVRLWPAVVLARLLVFWTDGRDQAFWLQCAVSLGTAAAGAAAAHVLLHVARIDLGLKRLRDALWLIGWGAIASPAIGATIGSIAVSHANHRTLYESLTDWLNWWVGNVTGVLVITPLLLAWARGGPPVSRLLDKLHLAACVGLTASVAYLVFDTTYSPALRAWFVFPMLIWAALGFGVRGAATAMLTVATLAVVGTVGGTGALGGGETSEPLRLVMLQHFVAIASVTALVLAVVADERRATDVLARTEARFRALVETSSQIVWTTGPDGAVCDDSPSWRSFTGQPREQWVGGHGLDAIHSDDRDRVLRTWRQVVERQCPFEAEYRLRDASGEYRQVAVRAVPLRDSVGRIYEWVGMNVDVTEQRRAEEALADARSRLENALTVGDIATWVWDIKTDRMFGDRNLARLFSVSLEDAAGAPLSKYFPAVHPDDRERVAGLVQKAIDTRGSYEADYRLVRPEGGVRWVEVRGQVQLDAAGEPHRMHGVLVDITDRKWAEAELRELADKLSRQTRMFDAALSSVRDYFFVFDPDGRFVYANKVLLELWGLSASEALGRSMQELGYPQEIQNQLLGNIRRAIETRAPVTDETTYTSPTGVTGYYEYILAPVLGPDGSVERVAGTSRDISLRKREQIELQAAKDAAEAGLARWRAVVGSMAEGVVVADAHGNLPEWNAAALEMHGYASIEDVRKHLDDFREVLELSTPDGHLIPFEDWPMSRVLRGESFSGYEVTVRRIDAELRRVISYSGSPVRDRAGRVALAVLTLHDVTEERRVQAALGEREAWLRSLVEQSAAGIAQTDLTGRIQFANDRFCDLVGYPREEVLRLRVHDLTHPDDLEVTSRAVELGALTGGEYGLEKRYVRRDGSTIWVAVTASVIRDAAGNPHSIIGVVIDISGRKRAEAAVREGEERLKLAVAIAEMGTFEIDLRTDAMTVNEPGRSIYGWAPGEPLTFAKVQTHFHREDREEVMRRVQSALRPGGPGEFEVEQRIVRVDGKTRWIRMRGRAIFDVVGGERLAVRCAGTYLDVTERREAELEREQLLSAERAARSEAERASRLKDEFLATLSHELRTPLNAILGWSQILKRGRMDDAQSVGEGINVIERNARLQAQLIADLLDMSRIISGKVRLDARRVELPELVEAVFASSRPSSEAKEITLQKILDPMGGTVWGDPDRLQQVLWNLLSNAVKFTPKGGRITVRLARINSHVEVSVTDTGSGIRPEFLPHVFDRFRQADGSTTRLHGGLGLGLSIVKHLVELHGGTVSATSPGEGRGSTFVVALPLSPVLDVEIPDPSWVPSTRAAAPVPAEDRTWLDGVTVLVVDDEPDTRELVKRVLSHCGAEVLTAGSAGEALVILREARPDVLLSDIGMPHEDGYALIRKVRSLPAGEGGSIPAGALTAFARSEDRQRALRAGFQIHIPKPVEPEELIAIAASLAGRSRRPQARARRV